MRWLASLALLFADPASDSYKTGLQYLQSRQPEHAVVELQRAAQLEPKNAQYQKAAGVAYSMMSMHDKAEGPLGEACRLKPELEDACYFYARNQYALDRFESSLKVLRGLVQRDPKPARIYLAIAQAHEGLGSSADAQSNYRKAIDLNQQTPLSGRLQAEFDPLLHFGVFLFRQGKTADAVKLLEENARAHANSGRAHFELGRALYHSGALAKAGEHLHRARVLGHGRQADILLSRTLQRLGRHDEAVKLLESTEKER